nr:MAG TPA: hypothetical protein [Caudoviricetes sp.]
MPSNRNGPVLFRPVRPAAAARQCGAPRGARARSRGDGPVPARPLSCHTARHNRNVCVPLTLERQSVNVLTCEFTHWFRGSGRLRRVLWGERGVTESPTVQVGPPNGNDTPRQEQPPDTDTTRGARNRGTTPDEHAT